MPRCSSTSLLAALGFLAFSACAPARPSGEPWPAAFPDADTVRVTELAPGVQHAYLWLPDGPWAVHVVEVDEAVCSPEITAVKAGPPLDDRATTSTLAAGAVASINADFFMLPGGTPVGAHVHEGRVLIGPSARPAYALDRAGEHRAGVAELDGYAAVPGDTAAVVQVNRPVAGGRHHPARPGVTVHDEWYGPAAPVDTAGTTLRLRRLPYPDNGGAGGDPAGDGLAREAGRGVVVSVHPPGEAVGLEAGHVALQAVGGAAGWMDRRTPGDTVDWRLALVIPGTDGIPAAEAVGGFPLLVARGRGVLAEQEGVIESFGAGRHPRTAVGWDAATDRIFWLVVDGRQAPYSAGMTLAELEWMFLRLGATDAINLDGGGSTALVLAGRLANRPSDPEGERPVANVLALRGCQR